jgi:hypothetical protein
MPPARRATSNRRTNGDRAQRDRRSTLQARRTRRIGLTPTEEVTMSHKFRLGQMVRLTIPFADTRSSAAEMYEIVRLMPADQTGEYSYRIKAAMSERAARESELRPV